MFENPVLDLIFAPWAAYALYSATGLGIFDRLEQGGRTAAELAESTGTEYKVLKSVLDACAGLGFLSVDGEHYINTDLSRLYLLKDAPFYLGDIMAVIKSEAPRWLALDDLVKGKVENTRELLKGEGHVDSRRFTLAMDNLARLGEADALANALDLADRRSLLDVGCGSGLYSLRLCSKNPGLRARLLDREEVLQVTGSLAEGSGLSDRIELRPTDIIRDSYGEGWDVVLLSDVLYQSEETCRKILSNAHQALARGGILVIRGYYVQSGDNPSAFGPLFNLHQLFNDLEREIITVDTLINWIREAGFTQIRHFALTEKSTCLTALES